MTYKETTTQTINYDYDDVILWIKMFAAKQLGISDHEINEEDIQITPEVIRTLDIKVTHVKTKGNEK